MNKSRRYAIWTGGVVILLLVMVWVIAFAVLALNRARITDMVITQINKQVNGTVVIGDLAPGLLRTFPYISVRLCDVSIRDSLWNEHHHDFFHAEKIYVRLQFFSLIKGKPKIGKVIVENAAVYLYTDECGYCNLHRTEKVSFSKGTSAIPEFTFYHSRLMVENQFSNSYHDIEAKYMDCATNKKDTMYDMHIEMKTLIHSLSFNTAKGSYLKEKELDGDFHLFIYPKNKISLDNIDLDIDHHPFTMTGDLFLHTQPIYYDLDIRTEKVNYKKAAGLLTSALRQKVDSFDIVQPFNAAVKLQGVLQYSAKPTVTVLFAVDNVDMTTSFGALSHCSFYGSYDNQVDSFALPGDLNSKFTFHAVSAEWSGMPITSPLVEINNLITPLLKCHLQSLFALKGLNELTESSTISFSKGNGMLDLNYNGSINSIDTVYPDITGSLTLTDADFRYIPRDLLFQNCNGSLVFKDEDVIINHLSATAGNTELMMTGKMINLLALLKNEVAQPLMEWNISTPDLNLNDFISYVRPHAQVDIAKKNLKNKIFKTVENIDRFLKDGTAQLHVDAGKVRYKKFVATNVAASIRLVENNVLFDDVSLNHAGGKVFLKGSLTNGHQSSQLALMSTIRHVNIPVLFQAFDNFGQDAITYKNMKGQMSATINLTAAITDKATVEENSMKGIVDFSIKNGELINFEPAVKIAATAFKKRDFSHIEFAELKDRFSINGSAIGIERMEIHSNVVVLFAEGIYDTKKGTDMSIQVPLSNLSKAENEISNTGKVGMFVRLRAKTGDDGKLGISWDPFNNALKERKAESKTEALRDRGEIRAKSGKE